MLFRSESYTPTGTKLAAPASAPAGFGGRGGRTRTSAERVHNRGGGSSGARIKARSETPIIDEPRVLKEPPKDPRSQRLYILVEDASDTETLTAIRRLCDLNLGFQEVVLVLREGETKRPLRMPFKVDASPDLMGKLKDLLGEEKVRVC